MSFLHFIIESVLLPFGIGAGDELVPPALDGTSRPVEFSCPFYGVEEDTLFVSACIFEYIHAHKYITNALL